MWAEDIDEITVNYEEDGVLLVKEEAKVVIARGAWPVLAFLYRELVPATKEYGAKKVTLRKFRKQHGTYRIEAKLNIGNLTQAAAIAEALRVWSAEGE